MGRYFFTKYYGDIENIFYPNNLLFTTDFFLITMLILRILS